MASKGSGVADVARIFAKGSDDEKVMIKEMDQFVQEHGLDPLDQWQAPARSKNSFLHELAELKCFDALQHAVKKHHLDGKIHRKSDGKSLLKILQEKNAPPEIVAYIEKFYEEKDPASNDENGDDKDDNPDDDNEPDAGPKTKMNIVWMDLEMTSIEKPEIMECAVIITDRNLKELARGMSTNTVLVNID